MRFFERAIKTENGCLEWPGQKHGGKFNYGIITLEVPGQKHSKLFRAHRISHEIFKGPIPNGFDVMHSCDNPSCVNPKHLSAGTRKENLVDMAKKGRMFNPAQKLTLEQVNFIKSSDLTQNELAKQFSVMQSTISRIKNGKRWKYPHQNKNKKE
jgi:predicted XRE-type DNA-binding protein